MLSSLACRATPTILASQAGLCLPPGAAPGLAAVWDTAEAAIASLVASAATMDQLSLNPVTPLVCLAGFYNNNNTVLAAYKQSEKGSKKNKEYLGETLLEKDKQAHRADKEGMMCWFTIYVLVFN